METKQTNSKEHFKRTNNRGVTCRIISKPGTRNYAFDIKGEDQIFFIELSEKGKVIEYPITFEEELIIMDFVIRNKILSKPRRQYIEQVKEMLNKIDPQQKLL